MRASVGDRLCVHGRSVGQVDHRAVILEVRGADGGPPYRVRYDDGHEAVVVPGPDTMVEPATDPAPPDAGVALAARGAISFEPQEDTEAAGGPSPSSTRP